MPENDPTSLISGLLGLGATIGTAIPSALSGQSEEELSRIAGGAGGQGTRALRRANNQAVNNTLAAASQGQGATRGLQVRQAIRDAERVRADGAERAASLASREQQAALGQLENVRQRRLQSLLRVGAATGQALGSLGATSAVASGNPSETTPKVATPAATTPVAGQQAPALSVQQLSQSLPLPAAQQAPAAQAAPAASPQLANPGVLAQRTGLGRAQAQVAGLGQLPGSAAPVNTLPPIPVTAFGAGGQAAQLTPQQQGFFQSLDPQTQELFLNALLNRRQ